MSEQTNAAPQKVQITVSGVLADLSNGLTRANIQAKYGLTGKDLKALFQHPKLKGKKTIPAPGFELIDDTADEAVSTENMDVQAENVEATQTENDSEEEVTQTETF